MRLAFVEPPHLPVVQMKIPNPMSKMIPNPMSKIEVAAEALVKAADEYPPEVMNEPDGAWRIGGSAKAAWRRALRDLREALA